MMNKFKRFIKLIENELCKSFLQKKTIVFIIFLIICVLFNVLLNASEDNYDWREDTKQRIENLEKSIAETKTNIDNPDSTEIEREMDMSILEFQMEELEIQKYRLEKEIPEYVVTPLKFVYKCKDLFVWIALFMVIFSANLVVNEYNWGTIRQLFIKPVSRASIFWAKYISAIVVTMIFAVILFVVSIISGYVFFGGNSTSIYEIVVNDGKIIAENMLVSTLKTTLVNIFITTILCAISMSIASVLRSNMLAVIVSFVLWIGSAFVGESITKNIFYQYFIVPNICLDGFLPGGTLPYEGATLIKSVIICIVYMFLFLFAGKYCFSKKDVY